MSLLVKAVADAVEGVVRKRQPEGEVALHRPFIGTEDADRVFDTVVDEPVGYSRINAFEQLLQERTGSKHAICVSSGTAALHLALLVADVLRDELVSIPSLTFAAGAAAIRYCQGIPSFGGQGTRVQIIVDLLGEPASELIHDHAGVELQLGQFIIEDAAEALGSQLGGDPLGTYGKIGILSFNNNKIVTTGGGGAVLTDDDELAQRVRFYATTARDPKRPGFFEHLDVGYNYRMGNINAAMGISQMHRLDKILEYKRTLRNEYSEALHPIGEGVWFNFGRRFSNAWLNELRVPSQHRDDVILALAHRGIFARPLFTPLHLQAPYEGYPVTDAERLGSESRFGTAILLPSGRLNP